MDAYIFNTMQTKGPERMLFGMLKRVTSYNTVDPRFSSEGVGVDDGQNVISFIILSFEVGRGLFLMGH